MNDCWVVNSSPIIILSKISRVEILLKLCRKLIIPEGVSSEISQGPENDPGKVWLKENGFRYVPQKYAIEPPISNWDLGVGESEVLAFALKNPGWIAVIDDRAARKCAYTLKIPFIGTLGVIWQAKKKGVLTKVRPVFQDLVQGGFRVEKGMLNALLEEAGEDPIS